MLPNNKWVNEKIKKTSLNFLWRGDNVFSLKAGPSNSPAMTETHPRTGDQKQAQELGHSLF